VANRFVRRIRSGDIDSIEELKSEFKELAKLTHPDLQGVGKEGEFVAARAEYEAALRDFEKHRFGARRGAGGGTEGTVPGAPRPDASADESRLSDAAWLCLELMLKRGFPKSARHEKERLRYEYARWRLEQALGETRGELFRAFESELLDMRAFGSPSLAPTLRLLRDLIEYRYVGLAAMRTHVVLSFGRLKADHQAGTAVRGFVGLLAAGLGIGGELV
jgi:hypothetical protein